MELVNIAYNGIGVESQTYNSSDNNLITNNYINNSFGQTNDYIELFIYDENNNLIDSNYNLTKYKPDTSEKNNNGQYTSLLLDPQTDASDLGYDRGAINVQYNFLKNLFNSSYGQFYWIKQISTSRTELILSSQNISDSAIKNGFDQYQVYASGKNYYSDFYLNFGSNDHIIAINVAYTEDVDGAHLLIKLYEPLPLDYDVKSTLWIVDKVAESVSYNVNIQIEAATVQNNFSLRGPNFKININDRLGQTTPYYNYQNLITSPITSSYQQLLSYYQDKSININVDYGELSNFVHFSSAIERLKNFVYKVGLIESYNAQIGVQQSITSGSTVASGSITILNSYINNIINKFDGYEYYLYYESSSFSWPKSNSQKPYILYSTTSSQATNWLGSEDTVPTATTASLLYSASFYDDTNKDKLTNSIPQYLQDDPSNAPYNTFMYMVGQHFDNIWIYYKDVTNRYNNTNNPNTGISLDVVGDALKGLGIELYTNSNISDNLYYSMFGINADGSLLPPTGSEMITNYVTSSISAISSNQLQGEVYKRLYHNLPYLLKTKGTRRSIKALIACYGIPDSILTVNEFGGYNRNVQDGVYEINNEKITIVTGSNELTQSVLSPYTTLQYFDTINRLDISKIEVGFSPADAINKNITGSLGYFNIDQYIGNPSDQYSSSYSSLDTLSKSYFANYTYKHSIWEYLRMIKFYNNSLFKMIKDFVPARADVSTGIIIKSHMLERNKYARHEPTATTSSFEDSIDMITIAGSDAMQISASTAWVKTEITSLGLIPVSKSDSFEKYTGRFGGSTIYTGENNFSQLEQTYQPFQIIQYDYQTLVTPQYINYGATYQNVDKSVKSIKYYDLDYNGSQNAPVNLGLITQSINNGRSSLSDIYAPFAQLQDYNYSIRRSTLPRYDGSKSRSAIYNTFTIGDSSYGSYAAIDKIKLKYAYLVNVYSPSFGLPNRSNAQIKYLIDNQGDTLNLTKANTNIFDIQNIFKSGESSQIALYDYNPLNYNVQTLTNNKNLDIYEGGFRYLPILHNVTGSATSQTFTLTTPIAITIPGGSTIGTGSLNPANFTVSIQSFGAGPETDGFGNFWYSNIFWSAIAISNLGSLGFDVAISFNYDLYIAGANYLNLSDTIVIPGGTDQQSKNIQLWPDEKYYVASETVMIADIFTGTSTITTVTGGSGGIITGSASTYYTTQVTSSVPCIYYNTGSNQLVFNSTIAQYYSGYGITFNSTSDTGWTESTSSLDKVILPFTLTTGDRITFYDTDTSLGWDERFEYIVASTAVTGSGTGSRLLVDLDRTPNLILFTSESVPDSVTNANYKACKYIVFKHLPDETNLILKYTPIPGAYANQPGLIYPQYLDKTIKENAGNVLQKLKANNLI